MYKYLAALIILAFVLVGQFYSVHGLLLRSSFFHVFMHIAGGIGIGLLVCALTETTPMIVRHRRLWVIGAAFSAGIVWELFEIYYNISGYKLWTTLYYFDTAKDLANDLIGGLLVALLACGNKFSAHENKNTKNGK